MYGGERASALLGLPRAKSDKHEYGCLALTLELVDSMDQAIDHIHSFGSGHTEAIITGGAPMALGGSALAVVTPGTRARVSGEPDPRV